MKCVNGFAVLIVLHGAGMLGAQKMVRSTPAHRATEVRVDIGELNFYFDRDMVTDSWSFIEVKWAKFPPLEGKNDAPWVNPRHCRLKIGNLQPDTIYVVQLNSGSKMGFRAASNRMPLSVTRVMFTTAKAKKSPGGAKAPTPEAPVGGGAQPKKDATIGGGGKQPKKDTTIGGGAVPLTAGRKILLKAAVRDKQVLHRVLKMQSRYAKESKLDRVETLVLDDTYTPVSSGEPKALHRAVLKAERTTANRATGKTERRTTELHGLKVALEVKPNGVVTLAAGQNVSEDAKRGLLYAPIPELMPGRSLLPDREVAIGEEWTDRPEVLDRVLTWMGEAKFTVRFKLLGVENDAELGCGVARIRGTLQGTIEVSEMFREVLSAGGNNGLTGRIELRFAPSLGLVTHHTIQIDVAGGCRLDVQEDARAEGGAAPNRPAGESGPPITGKWKSGLYVFEFVGDECHVTALGSQTVVVPVRDNRFTVKMLDETCTLEIQREGDRFVLLDREHQRLFELDPAP